MEKRTNIRQIETATFAMRDFHPTDSTHARHTKKAQKSPTLLRFFVHTYRYRFTPTTL